MTIRTLLAVLALTGTTTLASAQSDAKGATDAQDDLLAGPKVAESAEASGRDAMRDGKDRRSEIAPRRWFQLVRDLELSDEQRQVLRSTLTEMEQARKDYQKAHGAALREVRARMKARRESGEEPTAADRERMAMLLAAAPKATAYQKKIWAELDEGQREQLQTSIDKVVKERQARTRQLRADKSQAAESTDARAKGSRDRKQFDEMSERRRKFLESRRDGDARRRAAAGNDD